MKNVIRILGLCLAAAILIGIPFLAQPVAAETPSVTETEIDTDSYFYDRINPQAQWCYNYLKALFDNYENMEKGEMQIKFYSLDSLPENVDLESLADDFRLANCAIWAENPLTVLKCRMSGNSVGSYVEPGGQTVLLSIYFQTLDILTEDMQRRAEARIQQIVSTIGEGDRYTKLRKMMDFLMNNTFYDPYVDCIDLAIERHQYNGELIPNYRHSAYDSSCYGLFLENIAICGGYSNAVKVLCDKLEIPCIMISNKAHAWNLVQMDDGQWYRLDATTAVRVGWDGWDGLDGRTDPVDDYFANVFLNNKIFGLDDNMYDDPYMFSAEGRVSFRGFPELAEGRYVYTGNTTDFSYTIAGNTYVPCEPTFSYVVNKDNKTCTIVNYEGPEIGDLVIPETIDDYTVTAVAICAFYYRSGFTGQLVIPDTVEYIDHAAFMGCYGFSSIKLPAKLRKVGVGAFAGCKGITEIILPDTVTDIEEYAFYDCNTLSEVVFGCHVQAIEEGAFNEISDDAVFKCPVNSIAHRYATDNGIDFQKNGTLCDFQDIDGDWEFNNQEHFHTCQHGVPIDRTFHTSDSGVFNCGEICNVCDAQYCTYNGFAEEGFTLVNKHPASCKQQEYTGDWMCICGQIVHRGEYIGEHGPHIVINQTWVIDEDVHYKLCTNGHKIDVTNHSWEDVEVIKEPTCKEEGLKTCVCSVCEATTTKTIDILLFTHSYNGVVTREPTCARSGVKTYVCTDCGRSYTELMPRLDHSYQYTVVDPTCMSIGYTIYTCTVCGDSYTEEIAKLTTHSYNGGVVTKEPTCKEAGVKKTTCTVCRHSYTEEIAKLTTHKYNKVGVVTKEPTCKETGIKTFTCRVCGDSYTEEIAKLTTHSYDSGVVTKDPTCKETGVKTTTCTVCGDSYTEDIVMLTHSYDSGVVTKEPTCKETGVKTFTCTVCGDSRTESVAKQSHGYENGACTVCGESDPDYALPTEPGVTEPTEPEVPVEQEKNPFDAIIQIIMQFLAAILAIFGIKL